MNLLENRLFVSLVSILFGSIITFVITHLLNKTKKLKYTVQTDRIALASNDQIFGSIKVEWQNVSVKNLYNSIIEIENSTTKDLTNLKLKVWTAKETTLLGESTAYDNTTYIAEYDEDFKNELKVLPGQQPTNYQQQLFFGTRIYNIPVFNRGQKIQFKYLLTHSIDTELPGIWLDLMHTGVKIKRRYNLNKIFGVPSNYAIYWGAFAAICTLVFTSMYLQNSWLIASICIIVGYFAQLLGIYIYKTFKFLWDLITK